MTTLIQRKQAALKGLFKLADVSARGTMRVIPVQGNMNALGLNDIRSFEQPALPMKRQARCGFGAPQLRPL